MEYVKSKNISRIYLSITNFLGHTTIIFQELIIQEQIIPFIRTLTPLESSFYKY